MSLFPNSKINSVFKAPDGSYTLVSFELDGQAYQAMDAGPHFSFSEGISLYVHCASQEEVDHYWNGLIANGGEPSQCGWLKDPFGVSWQIIPEQLIKLTSDPDPEKAHRATQAMLTMQKIVISEIEAAYQGETTDG